MKATKSGKKWAHVSCALWIPEVDIGCVEKMEPITKISRYIQRLVITRTQGFKVRFRTQFFKNIKTTAPNKKFNANNICVYILLFQSYTVSSILNCDFIKEFINIFVFALMLQSHQSFFTNTGKPRTVRLIGTVKIPH